MEWDIAAMKKLFVFPLPSKKRAKARGTLKIGVSTFFALTPTFSYQGGEGRRLKGKAGNALAVGALCLVLAGCSLPGFSFHGRHKRVQEYGKTAGYSVQAITPALLKAQAEKRRQARVGQTNPALKKAISDYSYHVQPQDVIGVTVWGHPEFSPGSAPIANLSQASDNSSNNTAVTNAGAGSPGQAGFTVQADGTIYFPYVGKLHIAGLTTEEIRAKLTKALKAYVVNPQIDVTVIGFHGQTYQLAGAVVKPGLYPITNVPITVSQAIQAAGGVLQTSPTISLASKASAAMLADLGHVVYIHDGKRSVLNLRNFFLYGDESQDRLVHPGDIIQVPDNSFDQVHLIGEVQTPGNYPIDNGQLNLAQALGEAGGLNLTTANPSRIFVFRGAYQKPQIFWLDARSPEAMLLATQFAMQPQDVVFVATAGISTWNRIITQILPTVQTLYETKVLVHP